MKVICPHCGDEQIFDNTLGSTDALCDSCGRLYRSPQLLAPEPPPVPDVIVPTRYAVPTVAPVAQPVAADHSVQSWSWIALGSVSTAGALCFIILLLGVYRAGQLSVSDPRSKEQLDQDFMFTNDWASLGDTTFEIHGAGLSGAQLMRLVQNGDSGTWESIPLEARLWMVRILAARSHREESHEAHRTRARILFDCTTEYCYRLRDEGRKEPLIQVLAIGETIAKEAAKR